MSRVFWFALTLILTLILTVTGCKATKPDSTPFESPLLQSTVTDSPLLKPTMVDTATPVPQPPANLGTVTGALVRAQVGLPSTPMAGVSLYLSPLIYSDDGTATMARHNKELDSKAIPDETGRFVFPDIAPNTYALVYSSVTSEFLLKNSKSEEDLLITVVAGQIIGLGEIYVETP